MADDKLFPESQSGEQAKAGASPKDAAAGASAYIESAADGGDIQLSDLPGLDYLPRAEPDENQPVSKFRPGQRAARASANKTSPAEKGLPEGLAADFPEEALDIGSAPGLAPLSPAPEAGGEGEKSRPRQAWDWFCKFLKSIPPIDDIFDNILRMLGLRRQPEGLLRRAASLSHRGRLAEAVRYFREYQTLRPLAAVGYDGLGRVYFRMGLSEEANREFIIADSMDRILHNRDDLDAAAALAEAFLERKQTKIAISLIEPVLIAHFYSRGNAALLKAMGKVYAELRANKKMYQVFEAGLKQYPRDYEFYIFKGQADLRLGNSAEGERLTQWGQLMKKLKENPRDANAKMAMGEIFIKEERMEEGLQQLREAAAIQPENSGVRWRLFRLYQKVGHFDEAEKYILEIVDLEPENEEVKYRLADFYRRNKHSEQAVESYKKIIDHTPRDPKPYALLGETLSDMGSFEEGQKMKDMAATLEAGLKENPDHKDTVRFMKYLFNAGYTEEGLQWLERGLGKWPYHGELILTKAKLLYNEYRFKEAAALLKRLISVKPDMAEPHIWIAMCYQRIGDNMAALAEAQLATRLAPKSYTAHKVLGDILKEQKKISQATAAYEAADLVRQTWK